MPFIYGNLAEKQTSNRYSSFPHSSNMSKS
uniref:Uncharacterized protein n=1 Tax=Arundo donax TaxID=35708 RepID=A0A0A8YII8_ARUDO